MRPIVPKMTNDDLAVMGLREARFVRPPDLFLVEGPAGIGNLPGPDAGSKLFV
jgi:hypothetical protein